MRGRPKGGLDEVEEPFEVPGDADQGPFPGDRVESPQVKLSESENRFNDSEYRQQRNTALRNVRLVIVDLVSRRSPRGSQTRAAHPDPMIIDATSAI